MADGEVERLTTVFDADYTKLDAKLNAIIRAQYGAAQKIGDQWKKVQADSKMEAALSQAAALKNIQLENQLALARASGNRAQIKALTEELLLEQQISRLKRAGITGEAALTQARAHVGALSEVEKAREGVNIGRAATSVFDASRFAVLEEGSAKLRVFGSSLEALGPIGIGAAVGIVAAAVAIENVKKAVEEVGSLKVTADKLGEPIEKLQELQFAAKESHVPVEALNSSLGGLNETLGKLRSGVAAARLKQLAEELLLTPEELQQAKSASDLLPILADRIKALPSASEQYAAASKANVLEILPLLLKGSDGIRELTKEYRDLGVEVSGPVADGIAQGNLQMEKAHDIAHDKLRNSLIEMGPLIANLSTAWDTFAAHAVDALHTTLQAAGTVLSVAYGGRRPFEKQPGAPGQTAAAPAPAKPAGPTRAQIEAEKTANAKLDELSAEYVTHSTHRLAAEKKIEEINAARAAAGDKPIDKARADKILSAAAAQDAKPGDRAAGAAQRKAEAAAAKLEAARARQAEEVARQTAEIDTAEKNELSARAALITNITDLAQARADEVTAETKAKNDAALAAYKKVKDAAASTEAEKLAAFATYDRAVSLNNLADGEKKLAITNRLADEQARNALAVSEAGDQARLAALEAAKGLAVTATERRDLELKILKIQQDEARARIEAVLASKTATDADKAQAKAQLDALPAVQKAQTSQVEVANRDPIKQYLASIQDLNSEIKTDGVSAARSLSSGLADAVVNAKDLGDVASNVFRTLIQQILEQTLERDVAGPILAVLGFADGGKFRGAGGPRTDSNLVAVSDGEYIVNAKATAKYEPLLDAINRGAVPRFADGGPVSRLPLGARVRSLTPPTQTMSRGDVHLNVGPIEAGGAIDRDAIEGMVRKGSERAVVAARALARGDVANLQYQQGLNG